MADLEMEQHTMELPQEKSKGWMKAYRDADELPTRLSMLCYLFLSDMKRSRHYPGTYRIDMREWHNHKRGVCLMCAAGSLMEFSLGKRKWTRFFIRPGDVARELGKPHLKHLLEACEYLRRGNATAAYSCAHDYHGPIPDAVKRIDAATPYIDYRTNPVRAERRIKAMADALYAAGH